MTVYVILFEQSFRTAFGEISAHEALFVRDGGDDDDADAYGQVFYSNFALAKRKIPLCR